MGGLSEVAPHAFATRAATWLSVLSYPLGLCALLRAQGKPIAFALLALPLIYSATFYLGLLPSLAATGLALYAIALLHSPNSSRSARLLVATLLPITSPFGVCITLLHAASALAVSRRRLPWLDLLPLALGGLYWGVRALHADGVAAFNHPGLALRLLRLPETVIGGFYGRGDVYMLGAQLILWLLLARGQLPRSRQRWRELSDLERALWLTMAIYLVGYLVLPSSAWSTTAIQVRAGVMAFSLLPAVLPAQPIAAPRARTTMLLLAFAIGCISYTSSQLIRFDREARPFAALLARVPARPKLLSLLYNSRSELARANPYLHFAAYAQAERGGSLALSAVDYSWTAPLRRRRDSAAVAPVYGSEWNPTLMHEHPREFAFYDTTITRGPERREMTIMNAELFTFAAASGSWLLFVRP
jgi:hypothetical protein